MNTYTFNLTQFMYQRVNIDAFTDEIQRSPLVLKAIENISQEADNVYVVFFTALTPEEEIALAGLVAAHAGNQSAQQTETVQIIKPLSSQKHFFTFNWCDKTTWYEQSVRVTGEVLDKKHNAYHSNEQNWIDLEHGKISQEDNVSAPYLPKVYVNGTEVEREDPDGRGGHYRIEYSSGIITFKDGYVPEITDVVTADYSYATGGRFTIAPSPGHKLHLQKSEMQMSVDATMEDTIVMSYWMYAGEVAKKLGVPYASFLQAKGLPAQTPENTSIPVRTLKYKGIRDFINLANGNFPVVPPLAGTSSWRGISVGSVTFPFVYEATQELSWSKGMFITVEPEHSIPFGGSWATVVWYALSCKEA